MMNGSQGSWIVPRLSSSIVGASIGAAVASQLMPDNTIPGAFLGCVLGRTLTLPFCALVAIAVGVVGSLTAGPRSVQSSSDTTLAGCGTIVLSLAGLVNCFPLYKMLGMQWFFLVIGLAAALSFVPPRMRVER